MSSCPASLSKRIATVKALARVRRAPKKIVTLTEVAGLYARSGECSMARTTLRHALKALRKS